MAQIYDISQKITNELPKLVITDDITVTINNRKSVVLNIQAMVKQNEIKAKEAAKNGEDFEEDEAKFTTKALEQLVGAKNAQEIEKLDLPLPEYQEIFQTIMSIATGTYGETPIRSVK